MGTSDWQSWYSWWGWVLWYGIILLLLFNMGKWGYVYRARRMPKDHDSPKDALGILNERYALGSINQSEYLEIKAQICSGDVLESDPEPTLAKPEKNVSVVSAS